jgi:thiopurine S-methyltransferase
VDADFWQQMWNDGDIGFHKSEAHPLLVEHLPRLGLGRGSRVFIPLCGKTRDIAWLLSQRYRVAGAELSEIAVQQLFEELGVAPEIEELDQLKAYRAEGVDIFVGDIFQLTQELLGPVHGLFDRGALVALPPEVRVAYAKHLMAITASAPQLLVTFLYDQSEMSGPPFSITETEVAGHYQSAYQLSLLPSDDLKGGFKNCSAVKEELWLLGTDLKISA